MGNVSSRVNGVPGYMLPKGVSRRNHQVVRSSQETIEHVPEKDDEVNDVKPSTPPNTNEANENGVEENGGDNHEKKSDSETKESDNEGEGSDKEVEGSDKEDNGTDNEGTDKEVNGLDNESKGSDNEGNGSDNESKSSDKEVNGSDNEADGTDKEEVNEEVTEEKVEEAEAVPDELVTNDNPEDARTISRLDDDSIRITIRGRPVVLRIPPELRDTYDPTDKLEAPDVNYNIGWAYGCPQAESLEFIYATSEMVYPVGSVVVIYSIESHSQRFYTGHTNLVTCLAICPDKTIIATGQQEGHGSGTNTNQSPHIQIWNYETLSLVTILGKTKNYDFTKPSQSHSKTNIGIRAQDLPKKVNKNIVGSNPSVDFFLLILPTVYNFTKLQFQV